MKMFQKQDPYVITCEANTEYEICRCGQTKNPPFFDSTHCRCDPFILSNKQKTLQWVCGCAKSKEMPICDGAHNPRNAMTIWEAIKDIVLGGPSH